jgi:signal transduction histidine kinase/CheY-like chemotaxis protein
VLLVGVLVGAYALEFLLLAPVLGDAVFAFALIPIVAIAWLYGLRGGIVGAAAMIVASLVMMQLFGGHDGFRATQIPRILAGLAIGAGAGWAREVTRALRDANQDLERKVAERTAAIRHELEARKELEARAAAADRMAVIGTLTAGIGHEINNPLAVIIANLESIEHSLPAATPAVTDALRDAQAAARRASEIIQNMRVFIQSNSTAEVSDVRRVVTSTVRMVANEIQHRARLEIDIEDTRPVALKPGQLGQILLNLLVNALHALPERAVEHNLVRIEVRPDGERVRIRVTDTGGGIPRDMQERIFEPFFTTKPIGVGTGLGLWVCHHIVSAAGGEIALESSTPTGTVFRIGLPTAQAPIDEVPPLPVPIGKQRGRLLVIDDDTAIRRSFSRFVRNRHDVVVAESATVALQQLRDGERFDVILCDIMMPEMNGREFFARVQELAPEQAERIVFMTGGAFTADTRDFLPTARRLLEKPFEAAQLEAMIQDVLHSYSSS